MHVVQMFRLGCLLPFNVCCLHINVAAIGEKRSKRFGGYDAIGWVFYIIQNEGKTYILLFIIITITFPNYPACFD